MIYCREFKWDFNIYIRHGVAGRRRRRVARGWPPHASVSSRYYIVVVVLVDAIASSDR